MIYELNNTFDDKGKNVLNENADGKTYNGNNFYNKNVNNKLENKQND